MFHGTRKTDPTEILKSDEGFDMRFSNAGMWGTGVYFADKASYSDIYASQDPNEAKYDIKQMFIAKVLVGNMYQTEPDKTLKVPPIDDETGERYDSV